MKKLALLLVLGTTLTLASPVRAHDDDDDDNGGAAFLGGMLGGLIAPRQFYPQQYYYPQQRYYARQRRCWYQSEPEYDAWGNVTEYEQRRVCQ